MSRKRVALSVLTSRRRRQQQKRRRHNDDIHDKNVENQQPSPHPIPSIILPQAFFHDPNTFKSVSHISATNNTSSTVLNFKTWFTTCVHVPKSKLYLYEIFYIIFAYIVIKPEQSRASQLVNYNLKVACRNPSVGKKFKPFKTRIKTLDSIVAMVHIRQEFCVILKTTTIEITK